MTRQTHFVTFSALAALCLGLLLSAPVAVASDWPQFRGPHRDGRWNETKGILESFPKAGLKIKWRHPVRGGFSNPVVAEGRAFVFDVELTKPTSRDNLLLH
jgi:outer membrane protein assembly factor BamB